LFIEKIDVALHLKYKDWEKAKRRIRDSKAYETIKYTVAGPEFKLEKLGEKEMSYDFAITWKSWTGWEPITIDIPSEYEFNLGSSEDPMNCLIKEELSDETFEKTFEFKEELWNNVDDR